MSIHDLRNHPVQYVSIGDLADYWAVSRQQIYKQIESGSLKALRFGPRLYRVPTAAAVEFERAVSVLDGAFEQTQKIHLASPPPMRIGVKPLRSPVNHGKK